MKSSLFLSIILLILAGCFTPHPHSIIWILRYNMDVMQWSIFAMMVLVVILVLLWMWVVRIFTRKEKEQENARLIKKTKAGID